MTAAEVELLRSGAARLGVQLDSPAVDRLERFLALLGVWNRRVHLTGERDMAMLIKKHTVDSLAVLSLLPSQGPVLDLGSGAGFPGIVLACVRPELDIVLVEARRRPTSFLREVIRAIPLRHARVLDIRAEEAAGQAELGGRAHAVVGRALRLDLFLGLATPFVAPDGVVIAMQTPRTARSAGTLATRHGLRMHEKRDYFLPGGESRCLLVFTRAPRGEKPVS